MFACSTRQQPLDSNLLRLQQQAAFVHLLLQMPKTAASQCSSTFPPPAAQAHLLHNLFSNSLLQLSTVQPRLPLLQCKRQDSSVLCPQQLALKAVGVES